MKAIDIKDAEELLDKARHISNDQMRDVCLVAQAERTCRYIMIVGENGFVCAKGTKMGDVFDDLAKKNKMTAKSNNCEGLGKNATKEKSSKETEKEKDTEKNT